MKLSELWLQVRPWNCLDAEGIETVDELCKLTERDLLNIRNFGQASLRDVKNRLAAIGRCLANGVSQPPQPAPPTRYGIIPCARCAFFVPMKDTAYGSCRRHVPKPLEMGTYNAAPGVHRNFGCGDGLLREEAAPLPPEPKGASCAKPESQG